MQSKITIDAAHILQEMYLSRKKTYVSISGDSGAATIEARYPGAPLHANTFPTVAGDVTRGDSSGTYAPDVCEDG